ncbi:MAG: hypothetical protein WC780_00960 [Lentimicrobiaceae bacterium]
MRRLSSIILLMVLSVSLLAQKSPHGDSFRANCDDCHKTSGWKVDLKTINFDHKTTKFPLVGQHQVVNCKECHTSLEFAKAQTECSACHDDIHEQTVGNDCARCHTPDSWVVTNITKIHQQSRFPLIGPHTTADCKDCHKNLLSATGSATPSASRLRFDPMGIECYDCHKANYLATTRPNHKASNYSTNCTDCHNMNSFEWKGAGINHNFFPLTDGHSNVDCNTCHKSGVFSGLSKECANCHQPDYNSATNPNHKALNFSTTCSDCHSLTPGWKPAEYKDHDAGSFPIYSGKHKGEWNSCADCHTNPANYSLYSCTTCHEHSNKSDVDSKHNGVSGYSYNSIACYGCHPTGSGVGKFDHAANGFPLTNGHASVDCASCHTNGFAGTSNACASCHTNNYSQTSNPNHSAAGISNECATCHTTTPGWKPAAFPTHSNYYVIEGAHVSIANQCATCHNGNYNTTPNTCEGCHTTDYNQTSNPNHTTSLFPKTCETCHSQTAWIPGTFNHSTVYPLTGAHATVATNCALCHANGYANTPNTCVGCHQADFNQSANPNHQAIGISTDCAACHTTNPGWTPATFATHNTYYVLAGAHVSLACATCHNGNYNTTPNTCAGCHITNYNNTTNPNHTAAQFPNTCATCHTQSTWTPSTWNHTTYFPISSGKHANIACTTCHTNAANYAVFTCVTSACHSDAHNQNQGSVGCYSCHPTGKAD